MDYRSVLLRRVVCAVLALSAQPARGQQEQSEQSGRSIETIVVTAQKREQSLQDVPIVVIRACAISRI
jgi:outer membrane cobalamin receptor